MPAAQIGNELEDKTDESSFVAFVADSKPAFTPPPETPDALPSFLGPQSGADQPRQLESAPGATSAAITRSADVPMRGGLVATLGRALRRAHAAVLRAVLSTIKCDAAYRLWGMPYQERGIVGVIVYDTFGFHIPAEHIGGRWRRRTNVGYISNMAVAPGCRRCV